MINFLIDNWYMLVAALAVIVVAAVFVYNFVKQPKSAQMAKVQEWLLWAVAEAEKVFGGGTGQIKLRYVYDLFVSRFGSLAAVISFEAFSALVDKALEKFNEMLASNKKVEEYVATPIPTVVVVKEEVKENGD